jgi:hypothetical protein
MSSQSPTKERTRAVLVSKSFNHKFRADCVVYKVQLRAGAKQVRHFQKLVDRLTARDRGTADKVSVKLDGPNFKYPVYVGLTVIDRLDMSKLINLVYKINSQHEFGLTTFNMTFSYFKWK